MAYKKVRDLVPGVRRKLGNRQDMDDSIVKWIIETARNLSQNYPFEDLEVDGSDNIVQFEANKSSYPVTDFLRTGDEFGLMSVWWLFYSGSSGAGTWLRYRSLPTVTANAQYPGIPSMWTRHGKNFLVASAPAAAYYTYMSYQKKHPFDDDLKVAIDNDILMPSEWHDIIEYGAAIKGAPECNMVDMITVWRQILYGNGKQTREGFVPGLIHPLVSQFQKDRGQNEGQLSIVL